MSYRHHIHARIKSLRVYLPLFPVPLFCDLPCVWQAMDLIAEIDHPNVVVHLDSYHMNIEESSMADAVATCAPRLGYVHIGECHRGYLGSGASGTWPGPGRRHPGIRELMDPWSVADVEGLLVEKALKWQIQSWPHRTQQIVSCFYRPCKLFELSLLLFILGCRVCGF